MAFLEQIAGQASIHPSTLLLGPVPSSMERRAGKYRAQLLLTGDNRGNLQSSLNNCLEVAEKLPLGRKVRWSIDVDPVDLF